MENSFCMYLHDTSVIQDKYCNILQIACDKVNNLIKNGINQIPNNQAGMMDVDAASEMYMGTYTDNMD